MENKVTPHVETTLDHDEPEALEDTVPLVTLHAKIPPKSNLLFRKNYIFAFSLVCILSAITHFYKLKSPNSVVFDEFHFGKFISEYCCLKRNFFDIHPPHSKLLIGKFVKLTTDYDGSFKFKKIGQSFENPDQPTRPVPTFAIRFLPAFWGTLIPIVFFILLFQLGAFPTVAFFGSFLLIFDNALLAQTRILSLDGLLILSILISLCLSIRLTRTKSITSSLICAIALGISIGMAVGTKLTGLTALSMSLGILGLSCILKRTRWSKLLWIIPIMLTASSVYVYGWWVHFETLTAPGFGDRFYKPIGDFWTDFYKMQIQMYKRNAGLTKSHSYGTGWYSWPWMFRGVFYWSKGSNVYYLLGNPLVWWTTTVSLFAGLSLFAASRVSRIRILSPSSNVVFGLVIMTIGYFNAFLPYAAVTRALFLYHYLPPLTFACGFLALGLQYVGFFNNSNFRSQPPRYFLCLIAVFTGFILMIPLTSSFEFPEYTRFVFKIFPKWR